MSVSSGSSDTDTDSIGAIASSTAIVSVTGTGSLISGTSTSSNGDSIVSSGISSNGLILISSTGSSGINSLSSGDFPRIGVSNNVVANETPDTFLLRFCVGFDTVLCCSFACASNLAVFSFFCAALFCADFIAVVSFNFLASSYTTLLFRPSGLSNDFSVIKITHTIARTITTT